MVREARYRYGSGMVKVPDMTYDLWIGMGRRSVASE
jgi:hypothetical protein